MAAGALWAALFAVGFIEYTSRASVLVTGLGGLGLLGVWSARRRFLDDESLLGRWERLLATVGNDCVAFAVVNMTGRQIHDLIAVYWSVRPNDTFCTLAVALVAVLCWWMPHSLLWHGIEGMLYVALAIAAWTTLVVLRGGGFRGNHLATVVGSGATPAMILRGVAVAVVSYVVVDLVVGRWRAVPASTLVLVRPAIIFLTVMAMGLSYVVVTGAGSFTSNIPFTFAGVAATYGGHTLQIACELLYLGLMLISAIVLVGGVRDRCSPDPSPAGGVDSFRGVARRGVTVIAVTAVPLGIAEMFQLGAAVTLVGCFVVTLRAMIRVSREGEPWYEWLPPVVALAVTSLGLYGLMNRRLSWDGQGSMLHLVQTGGVVLIVSVVAYALERRRGRREGPGAIAFSNEREV